MKWFEEGIKGKQLIYCNKYHDENATDEEIMHVVVHGESFNKLDTMNFIGIESYIKKYSNLYYSNTENKVWQICGRASDIHEVIIPNTYLIREIGIWGESDEDIIKTYIGYTEVYDGLTYGEKYRISKYNDGQYFIPMNDRKGTSLVSKDKFV